MSRSAEPHRYLHPLLCMLICCYSFSNGIPAYTELSSLLKARPTLDLTTDIQHLKLDTSALPISPVRQPGYQPGLGGTNARSFRPPDHKLKSTSPGKTDVHHEKTISNNLHLVYEPMLKGMKETALTKINEVMTELRSYFKNLPGPNLEQIISEMAPKLSNPVANKVEFLVDRKKTLITLSPALRSFASDPKLKTTGTLTQAPAPRKFNFESPAIDNQVDEATILTKFIRKAVADLPINPTPTLEREKTRDQITSELVNVFKVHLSDLKMSKEEDWAYLVKQAKSLDELDKYSQQYESRLLQSLNGFFPNSPPKEF